MSSLPPLDTTDRVRGAYLRYLRTIYPFRRADLREAFHAATEEAEMLVKGPLLEASPPFVRGRSLNDLIAEGVLHEGFRLLNSPLRRRSSGLCTSIRNGPSGISRAAAT